VLNPVSSYFMDEGFAFTWEKFYAKSCTKMISHILTLTVCMWQHCDLEAMGKEHQFLVVTAGIVNALHHYSD
jgi:hypothetical protein